MRTLKSFPSVEKIRNSRMYTEYHELGMKDGWLPGNQQDNFNFMIKLMKLTNIPLKNRSCLDVGCGSGDLSKFLRERNVSEYLGIDIYDISLEKAREKYPTEQFIHADILSKTFSTTFDYVFCSGALTIKLQTIDNYDFLYSMVKKMWDLAIIGVVFNVLTSDDPLPDPDLFFYNQKTLEKICEKIIGSEGDIYIEKTPNVFQVHVYLWKQSRY